MNTGLTGWLNPDGKFYKCESWEHMDKAEELVKEYGYKKSECLEPEDDLLIKNGWVRISLMTVFGHEFGISFIRKLSQEQKNFLEPYVYEEYGFPVEEYDRKRLLEELAEISSVVE